MYSFSLVDAEMITKVVSELQPSTYPLFSIVNQSLSTGTFTDALKTGMIRPHLKKSHVDLSVLSTF